jgi:hypothetical protein
MAQSDHTLIPFELESEKMEEGDQRLTQNR